MWDITKHRGKWRAIETVSRVTTPTHADPYDVWRDLYAFYQSTICGHFGTTGDDDDDRTIWIRANGIYVATIHDGSPLEWRMDCQDPITWWMIVDLRLRNPRACADPEYLLLDWRKA